MAEWPHETASRLERDYPGWEVWYVPTFASGTVWCARRRDDEAHVLNADTAGHLAEYIAADSEPK